MSVGLLAGPLANRAGIIIQSYAEEIPDLLTSKTPIIGSARQNEPLPAGPWTPNTEKPMRGDLDAIVGAAWNPIRPQAIC